MDKLKAKELVSNQIEKDKDITLHWFENFLSHPSRMGEEEASQKYYAELLKDMGLSVDMWIPEADDMSINPNFMPARDSYEGSPNVVGIYKGKGNGRSIMLSGHVDVVPEGSTPWKISPWKGLRKDGKIYGRGAADMKGGLMANLIAFKAIKDAGIELKGDVLLASVIGEETGGAGTLSLIKRGYKADGAIVPEPSDLNICPVSLGVIWFRINIEGLQAHAANAHLGVNAISKAMKIVNALDECNLKERMAVKHPLYNEVPNPFNINIGTIEGGSFPTSVPGEAVICGRIAFSPDESVEDAKSVLENAVMKAAKEDAWLSEHLPKVEWYGFCLNSGKIDINHPLMNIMVDEFENVTGNKARVSGTPWGTDAGAMIRFGDTPTVVFGPGPRETAHQTDEYVDEEKVLVTAKVIASTIIDWCGLA